MEVFQHMFQCCSESRKRESLKDLSLIPLGQDKKRDSHQDENHNVNNILKSTFNKNDQDNRASSKTFLVMLITRIIISMCLSLLLQISKWVKAIRHFPNLTLK